MTSNKVNLFWDNSRYNYIKIHSEVKEQM